VLDDQATHQVAKVRAERIAGAGGLEAKEATARGRDADRSTAVVAVGHGNEASGDGRGRAAAGAAGGTPGVPGVAAGAEQAGLAGGKETELGCVGLAEDDEAGTLEPGDELAIVIGNEFAQEGRTGCQGHAGTAGQDILEQERHTGKGARGELGNRGSAGLLKHGCDDGVERGIQALDALDGGINQLDGSHLAPADELGLGGGVEKGEGVGSGHG
jgi:hypothetical protein